MIRRIFSILILGLAYGAIGGIAAASESRDAALQSYGWMTPDDVGVWLFPTDLLDYPNQAFGELPSEFGAADYAGGHLKLGTKSLRVFAGRFPGRGVGASLLGRTRASSYAVGNVPADDVENAGLARGLVPDGRIHALIGIPFGENARAALGADYSGTTWIDALQPGPTEGAPNAGSSRFDQAELITLHGGVALPLASFEQVTLGMYAGLPRFEGTRELTVLGAVPFVQKLSYQDDGGISLGFTARGTLKNRLGRETESYLYVQFETGSLDGISKHNSATAPEIAVDSRKEMAQKNLNLGFANNHHFGSRLLAIWSTEIAWTRSNVDVTDEPLAAADAASRVKSTSTTLTWPATIAVEGWAFPWWAVRASASSILWGETTTKAAYQDFRYPLRSIPENHDRHTNSYESVAFGTTFRLRGFSLDGVVNRSLLYDGPYFLGGSSTGVLTQLSLRYQF